ncbi:hypothetical protein C8D92_103110 [Tamilnaduibacter salinus]|uniref:Cytochrome oxidase Cu insertion factor (SCO1/SenC/PrrC family) n=1 Tax=Tamilnaduibacter salinus TaxID=1484056 RepID=A0A2A2I6I6_9GAMM|nr:hypothetical protein [Tamilnaduibacter salinus]PAV26916.1 hypothetical protein CF392_03680 [Tamilnaduibacter salinus]PVY77425.1 hypothetical protein C8D92_103110 [Tamilnaduibacter salinus]
MADTDVHEATPQDIRRGRRIALLLFLVGFGPIVVATIMFYTGWLNPSDRTNKGILIQPPEPVASMGLETAEGRPFESEFGPEVSGSHWTLLITAADACADACQEMLYLARQVNTALGKNQNRVKRAAWLEQPPADLSDYPEMRLLSLPEPASADWPRGNGPFDAPRAYLVDPFGNVMMQYGPDHSGKDMLEDIEHLMKISQLG